MDTEQILLSLNHLNESGRLAVLEDCAKNVRFKTPDPRYINNHIHTIYSFSPYSPSAAVFLAKANGLCTAGIMDHDSIGGADEFIKAGEILGLPVTVGLECRVSMAGTPFENVRTNNPDQKGVSYMTLHAVPHESINEVQEFFAPLRELRNDRNRAMTERINCLIGGINLDFDRDILPLSEYANGGSVTERHLMFALAKAMIKANGRGDALIDALFDAGVELIEKQKALLLDASHSYYEYDLLGILKSAFVPQVYIPATDECLPLAKIVAFAEKIGAILCYAYLGDVTDSVTGDKKAQKFEDDYLDELFITLRSIGVKAVTYMPPRNTKAQLDRVRALCDKLKLYQISGEDINSPRQEFVCKAMEDPQFSNLIDSAWALIGHERGKRIEQL